jgi:hypothetical protein
MQHQFTGSRRLDRNCENRSGAALLIALGGLTQKITGPH